MFAMFINRLFFKPFILSVFVWEIKSVVVFKNCSSLNVWLWKDFEILQNTYYIGEWVIVAIWWIEGDSLQPW